MSKNNLSLDVEYVRSQFPAFNDPLSSKWSFFENAGGSYVPNTVIERLNNFMIQTKVQPYADFESSKIITTITPSSYNWKLSSPPNRQDMHIKNRVDMYYYGPHKEVNTNEIWENIEVTTTKSLASHDNIVGYKAASGDLGFISQVIESTRDEHFDILSGDDEMTLPILCLGGSGVISVAANIAPELISDMVWSTLPGERHNFPHALSLNRKLCPIFRGLFIESNPIPIKEAMHLKYGSPPHLRLPLSRISDSNRQKLLDLLSDLTKLEHTI